MSEAKNIIKSIIPKEAGVEDNDIRFFKEFNEVKIYAYKPGLVIGKKGSNLLEIIEKTGWLPRVIRKPSIESDIMNGIRDMYYKEQAQRKKFLLEIGKLINKPILKSEFVKVTALGGFREVGRSSLLIETNHSKVLVDCGISPEPGIKGADAAAGDTNVAFPYINETRIPINELDAIIISHAHMDHIGFLPYLFRYGYEGPVYVTPPTRELAALLLNDYINLVKKSGATPLYDDKDVRKALMHMVTREYGEVTNVTNEIKLTFHNAGHILGSASVHLHIGEGQYNIVYSGDIKYGFTRLLDPADTEYPKVDALFVESTYGAQNDINPPRKDAEKALIDVIKRTIENKGKVLIPLFAVGRSQEIMLVLENYINNTNEYKIEAPIYIDGMILEASAIHTAYPEYLKENIERRILSNSSPFESEIFEIAKGKEDEILESGPAVILASGGMLNGGTALNYFEKMAEDEKNSLIFVGYNSPTSFGRRLQNGLKEVALPDEDGKLREIKVNIGINTVEGFSGHSDRRQLISYVANVSPRPKRVFTMHGEAYKCEDLSRGIRNRLHLDSDAPNNLDSMRLR